MLARYAEVRRKKSPRSGIKAENGKSFLLPRTPSVVKAQAIYGGAVCDCFMGAGVPPFMGALTPFALWGALKVFSFPFSVKKKELPV